VVATVAAPIPARVTTLGPSLPAAHVQGKPVDEFEYAGLAGEEGFEPSNGGSKVRLSPGTHNDKSLL